MIELSNVGHWSCAGKENFAGRAAAERVLHRIEARGHSKRVRNRGRMEAYCCRICGHWHIGAGPK